MIKIEQNHEKMDYPLNFIHLYSSLENIHIIDTKKENNLVYDSNATIASGKDVVLYTWYDNEVHPKYY